MKTMILLWLASLLTLAAISPAALAGTANAGLPGAGADPLAHMAWGITRDDPVWQAYAASRGIDRTWLGRVALQPRAVWLGFWFSPDQIEAQTTQAVNETTNGNPDALVQLATFALSPWEGQVSTGGWNLNADELWYSRLAAGIGEHRALVIEQVDLPFALDTASAVPERIDAFAARVLSAQPHTSVYIDAGAAGWSTPARMARLLIASGIRSARGFALNVTQYGSTPVELAWGAQIVAALAADGVPAKHFIVNTDENGSPYMANQVRGNSNDTAVCASARQRLCQRLGIDPTTQVAAARWHLGQAAADTGAADAYVWAGRPWDANAGPFELSWAIRLGANALYPSALPSA